MDNEKLKEQLRNLPKIKDHQSKALLYEKIKFSHPSRSNVNKRNGLKWIIPSLASLSAVLVFIIMLQSGIIKQNQTVEHFDQPDVDRQSDEDLSLSSQEGENAEEFNILVEDDDVNELDIAEHEAPNTINNGQMIYYEDEHQFPTFTIAVADRQNMYPIPLTLVSSSSTGDPNDYYNRINNFINEEDFGVTTFPFEDINFEFSSNQDQLYMTVEDDYQFPQGSSQAAMFQSMLNLMFTDYSFDHIILQTNSTSGIDLGPIGFKEAFELEPVEHQAYKLYQHKDGERLLIPVEGSDGNRITNFNEALKEMQRSEPEFDISKSIPEEARYQLERINESTISMTFSEYEAFGNNKLTNEMIQAILVTAKSFGYTAVELNIPGIDGHIGQFDINSKLPVPDGINPIILH